MTDAEKVALQNFCDSRGAVIHFYAEGAKDKPVGVTSDWHIHSHEKDGKRRVIGQAKTRWDALQQFKNAYDAESKLDDSGKPLSKEP